MHIFVLSQRCAVQVNQLTQAEEDDLTEADVNQGRVAGLSRMGEEKGNA